LPGAVVDIGQPGARLRGRGEAARGRAGQLWEAARSPRMHQGDELIAKVSATTAIAARERRCPVRPRYAPQPHRAHQVVDRSVSQKPKSRGRIATLTGSKFDRILTWRSNARVLVMFEERVIARGARHCDFPVWSFGSRLTAHNFPFPSARGRPSRC
jgi:hypothetical protein